MLTSCIACLFCFCYDLGRYLYDLESFSQSCASSIVALQSYFMAWRIERRMVRDISQSSAELFDGWGLLRRAVQEVWESCRIALAGATRELSRELGHSVAQLFAIKGAQKGVPYELQEF